jgi:hypothetical protein
MTENERGGLVKAVGQIIRESMKRIRNEAADGLTQLRNEVADAMNSLRNKHELLGGDIKVLQASIREIPRGLQGEKGIDGQPGQEGKAGKDGMDGQPGIAGNDGLPGAVGEKGADGIAGRDGVDGKDGKDGQPGSEGQKGADGAPGRDGIDGKDGIPGPQGKQGEQGAPGRDGLDGRPGENGLQGLQGEKGERGLAVTGPQGDKGIDGKDGRDGRDGKDGRDGAAGKDGLEIEILDALPLTGKTVPRGTFMKHRGGLVRVRKSFIAEEITSCEWDVIVDGIADVVVSHSDDLRKLLIGLTLTSGRSFQHTMQIPVCIYRGVFEPDYELGFYSKGDQVTYDGSLWICTVDETVEKPGTSKRWRSEWTRFAAGCPGRSKADSSWR